MKIWLIFNNKADIDTLNLSIHNELKEAHEKGEIGNYLPCTGWASVRKHPTLEKYASKYELNKCMCWTPYLEKYINENNLVELTNDWNEDDIDE